jgi:hypothetical protein
VLASPVFNFIIFNDILETFSVRNSHLAGTCPEKVIYSSYCRWNKLGKKKGGKRYFFSPPLPHNHKFQFIFGVKGDLTVLKVQNFRLAFFI